DDTATISVDPAGITTVTEGDGSVNVPVKLTITAGAGGSGPLQLAYPEGVTLPGNTHYTASPFTFPADSAHGAAWDLSVTAVDDRRVEAATEKFTGRALQITPDPTLNTSGNAVPVTATGSQEIDVNDNDRAQVTFAGTADVTEGGPADTTNVTATLALAL